MPELKTPKQLWKTTAVIWTDYDPSELELDDLAREAQNGDAYCSSQELEVVTDESQFPDTDFFDALEDVVDESEDEEAGE